MRETFKPRLEMQATLAVGILCAGIVPACAGAASALGLGAGLVLGLGVGAAGLAVVYTLAKRIADPLRKLTAAAHDIGRDPTVTMVPWLDGPSEIVDLSSSLRSLMRRTGTGDPDAWFYEDTEEAATAPRPAAGRDPDIDPVTGLLNRRAFLAWSDDAVPYFKRYGRTIAILIIDIDGFKTFNDVLGRSGGDAVIGHVADVLSLSVRVTDKVSRFGGQEFVVLLREIDQHNALALAERMRVSVKSIPLHEGDRTLPVSISVGVATVSTSDRDIQALIERADQALHAAKRAGGDTVKLSQPTIVGAMATLEHAA